MNSDNFQDHATFKSFRISDHLQNIILSGGLVVPIEVQRKLATYWLIII